jgi:hypothetical protein
MRFHLLAEVLMSKSGHSKNNNWALIFISGIVLFSVSMSCRQEIAQALEATWSIILNMIQDEEEAYVEPTPPAGGKPDSPVVGGNTAGNLKPVCFLNTGTIAATVMPWTYIPLDTESPAMPSNASTVASPGGNTSACLSLPLGTYTWCYHWELGDVNDDGYIDYAHSASIQRITLDESDSDDLSLAEKVTIVAPPGIGEQPGQCDLENLILLDIRPFIVESQNIDSYFFGYSTVGLAHNEDYVTLKGPITVDYYFHHCDAAPCTTPVIEEAPVRVVIPAGETHQFYLEDTVGEHLGNWDMYIQLISIDE